MVACFMLSSFVGVLAFTSSYSRRNTFGSGTGAILYAGLDCDGTELSLRECSSSYRYPQYCWHYSDVGVRCDHIDISGIIVNIMYQL